MACLRKLWPVRHYRISRWLFSVFCLAVVASCSDGMDSTFGPQVREVGGATVVECNETDMRDDDYVCEVSAGSRAFSIKGRLLGMEAIYRGGELLVDETGLIAYSGCPSDRPREFDELSANATQIYCPQGVISPGLINPHDHLLFNHNKPIPVSTERYDHRNDWRPAIFAPLSSNPALVMWSEIRHAMSGTTAIAGTGNISVPGIGGVLGFLRNLDVTGYPVGDELLWNVFEESPTEIVSDTFPLERPADFVQNEAECSQYPNFPSLGRDKFPGADIYLPHIAEGINAAAHNEFACLSSSARSGSDSLDENSAVIHGIALNADEGRLMADRKAALIWTPRSNVSLYGHTAPVRMFKNQGVLIALGTDWIPTGSSTMSRELTCAAGLNEHYFNNTFTDRELWLMATHNAAAALSVDDRIGSLTAGQFGDIAIFDGRGYENPYQAIFESEASRVALVLKRSALPFPYIGEPAYIGSVALYGDASIMERLPVTLHRQYAASAGIDDPLCEPIDVCGAKKMLCPLRETWWADLVGNQLPASFGGPFSPVSLQTLQSANINSYELFSCGQPTGEPPCIPFREGEFDGAVVSNGIEPDSDGDGITDDLDNCAVIFNPVRPMDNGVQADTDKDGLGDACDE